LPRPRAYYWGARLSRSRRERTKVGAMPRPTHTTPAVPDTDTASFEAARPRLFGIAYRVLGSRTDADDVVQDTWMRWHGTDRSQVRDPAAFLATVAARLAINVSQSARARHETGACAPEPADVAVDPAIEAERRDALADALGVVSARLTPSERAAYLLRVAFDYPYRRIAEVTPLSEANARQLVARARGHLDEQGRRAVSEQGQQQLLDAFVAAVRTGELSALERALVADIVDPRSASPWREVEAA
jgi:RNA polymerase sigma-70 factor, ECF subfamily